MKVREGSVLELSAPIESLEQYMEFGGGRGLEEALKKGPRAVVEEIKASGLRGRGGAGFPTGVKWETVGSHRCPTKFLVCNAAEGEPGTFKDRWLLRRNPYEVLEGVAIAALAVRAERAFVAIKGRFERELESLRRALSEMTGANMLGGVRVDIVTGPDDYLFGEEKAMLEVIEGNQALPRIFPPYRIGLFAGSGSPNPTAVNNVETLANVAAIMRFGHEWFRSFGTDTSPGTMVFTLVGDVQAEGLYELPLGTTLRELIHDIGGGPPEGREIKAVFAGAAHAIITEEQFDTPLDFDSMKQAGSGLGSGGFVVYDDSTCMVEATAVYSRFLYEESCAQCPPCKRNSQEITRCLQGIHAGGGTPEDLETIANRTERVTAGQLCYLPTGEALIVGSAMEKFRDEFEQHVGNDCGRNRDLVIPKLQDFDERNGRFSYQDQPLVTTAADDGSPP